MTALQLILVLLLILVAVVIVVVVLRRGSAQRDAHRVEAAKLRSEADTLAAGMAGQSAFADQAAERAEVARVEAEERAREAARLEAEAAEHRAAVEATQRDYEATMRRADDIDPDVKESAYPAIGESDGGHAGAGATQPDAGTEESGDVRVGDSDEHADGDVPTTRAERREAREAGDADGSAGWAAPAAASSAPAAGAVGGAAAGAAAWAAGGDDDEDADTDEHARRRERADRLRGRLPLTNCPLPSRPRFTPADERGTDRGHERQLPHRDHPAPRARRRTRRRRRRSLGRGRGLRRHPRDARRRWRQRVECAHRRHRDHRRRHGPGGHGRHGHGRHGHGRHRPADTDGTDRTAENGSHDVEARRGDGVTRAEGEPAEMTIISEPEAYATTEPVMASEQTAPVSPEQADAGVGQHAGDADRAHEAESHHEHTDAAARATTHPPRPARRWPRPTTPTAAPPTWRRSRRRSATTRRRPVTGPPTRASCSRRTTTAATGSRPSAPTSPTRPATRPTPRQPPPATTRHPVTEHGIRRRGRHGIGGPPDLVVRGDPRRWLRGRLGSSARRGRPAARPPGAGLPRQMTYRRPATPATTRPSRTSGSTTRAPPQRSGFRRSEG